jgi:hypothetical protein
MVNNSTHRLLVSGACNIKVSSRSGQIITNGPVYDLGLSKQLLSQHGLTVINQVAENDQVDRFSPEMKDDEINDFIMALSDNEYEASERCKTSVGMTVDCDAYAMKWNRARLCRWEYASKIYVKFGFSQFSNSVCLILCIHPSKW